MILVAVAMLLPMSGSFVEAELELEPELGMAALLLVLPLYPVDGGDALKLLMHRGQVAV